MKNGTEKIILVSAVLSIIAGVLAYASNFEITALSWLSLIFAACAMLGSWQDINGSKNKAFWKIEWALIAVIPFWGALGYVFLGRKSRA